MGDIMHLTQALPRMLNEYTTALKLPRPVLNYSLLLKQISELTDREVDYDVLMLICGAAGQLSDLGPTPLSLLGYSDINKHLYSLAEQLATAVNEHYLKDRQITLRVLAGKVFLELITTLDRLLQESDKTIDGQVKLILRGKSEITNQ